MNYKSICIFTCICPWYKNYTRTICRNLLHWSFPGGTSVKNLSANAGDTGDTRGTGFISGLERSPGAENDNPCQHSCLDKSMDREPGELQSMWSQRVRHN